MAALTENEIIDIVYSLYETDTEGWDTDSEEYLSARNYANIAISRWETYDNTVWRDLWTTLTASTQSSPTLVKTITAGTYTYTCPTNFKRPGSWVRTGTQLWEVIPVEKSPDIGSENGYWCWFTGNVKDGYVLNFNPNMTLTTGDSITYDYYKSATKFTATSSTTEVPDPYFIVYYILYRFLKNDGEDFSDEANQSEDLLENMRVINMSGYNNIPSIIEQTLINNSGFGN